MYIITLPSGFRVDLDSVEKKVLGTWSTEKRTMDGMPPDGILVDVLAPSVEAGGRSTPCRVLSLTDTAVNNTRRARVVADLGAEADAQLAALRAQNPAEAVEEVAAVATPSTTRLPAIAVPMLGASLKVCSPNSNNDEIARSIMKVSVAKALSRGEAFTGLDLIVKEYDAYLATYALSEKRGAGIKKEIGRFVAADGKTPYVW